MISTQKINFVAFHIDINQVVLKQAQDVAKAVNNENHEDEINLMFSSVKRLYPNAQLFVLTALHGGPWGCRRGPFLTRKSAFFYATSI